MKVIFSLIAGSFLMLGLVGCDGNGNMTTETYVLPGDLIAEILASGGDGEFSVSATATDNGNSDPSIEFN